MAYNPYEIYRKFLYYFPKYKDITEKYYSNGRNSIRIVVNDGSEYIFVYTNGKNFRFETFNSYKKRLKKKECRKCND